MLSFVMHLLMLSFVILQKKYKWMPEYDLVIRGTFHHIGQKTMKDTMNKIRTGMVKGDWIAPDVRAKLDAIWAGPDFAKKSEIAKQNRAVDKGAFVYTGGSVSIAEHRSGLVKYIMYLNYFIYFNCYKL